MAKSARETLAETLITARKAGSLTAGRGNALIDAGIEAIRLEHAKDALRREAKRFAYATNIGVTQADWERLQRAAKDAGL